MDYRTGLTDATSAWHGAAPGTGARYTSWSRRGVAADELIVQGNEMQKIEVAHGVRQNARKAHSSSATLES
jgi:hypothetical protein